MKINNSNKILSNKPKDRMLSNHKNKSLNKEELLREPMECKMFLVLCLIELYKIKLKMDSYRCPICNSDVPI